MFIVFVDFNRNRKRNPNFELSGIRKKYRHFMIVVVVVKDDLWTGGFDIALIATIFIKPGLLIDCCLVV